MQLRVHSLRWLFLSPLSTDMVLALIWVCMCFRRLRLSDSCPVLVFGFGEMASSTLILARGL